MTNPIHFDISIYRSYFSQFSHSINLIFNPIHILQKSYTYIIYLFNKKNLSCNFFFVSILAAQNYKI